ncbi:uncharacterized protein [Scyliorhinus torazame]|uniref:uncharacterized protein isoform X1 n=2 Tax=Scyliorhinus torazame TaxID=75743 RepID=UPI003B5AF187
MERADSEVIATTPPLTRSMEEQVSLTSSPESGTHLSNVSGFSLGEVIVQRAKQGNESGPQPQAAADIGGMTSASLSGLLLASAQHQPTLEEFPTMEEGVITVTEESLSTQGYGGAYRPRQVFAELQASGLSPALPLLASYSTQNQEEESLSNIIFHRSPVEFAPLRGTPDLSGISCEGYTRAFRANTFQQPAVAEVSSDHVRGSLSLSQHPLGDTSSTFSLSQHSLTLPSPKWSEATEDEDFARAEKYIRDQRFMELPSVLPCTRSDGSQPHSGEVQTLPVSGHEFPLVGELPTLLLQDEVGLTSSSGFTSSSDSATETNMPLDDDKRSSSLGTGNTHANIDTGKEWGPSTSDQPAPNPRWAPVSSQSPDPEPSVPRKQSSLSDPGITFPKPLGNGNISSSDPERPEFSVNVVQLQERQANGTSQRSHSEASLECQRPSSTDLLATSVSGITSGAGLVTANVEPAISHCGKDGMIIEVLSTRSGGSKGDGTELCDSSIRREQKDSELSPTVCPPNLTDSSFLTFLANPVCQSTPAVPLNLSARGPAQFGQIKGVANRFVESQAPVAGVSKFPLAPSFGKQAVSSTSQKAASSTSQASPGTLQSMPPLSYMEKVGAWDLHRCPGSKPSFDSLVLHGLRGISPRQRAYSAIADSLNHILTRISGGQKSDPLPRRDIAANFGTVAQQTDQQQSAQSDGQLSGTASLGAPQGGSQLDTRRRSLDDASLYKLDSRRSCLNEDRGTAIRSLESARALGNCLLSRHSGAGPLMQDEHPVASVTDRRVNIDSEQTERGPEHHATSPAPCPASTTIHPGQFDVSSPEDELSPPCSSQDTSRVGEHTLTVSGQSLTSLEVDNYVPIWTPSRLTPDRNHFNVEDRIPIYLQNLGINQSPGSILGPKGPSRQLDFTPVELKRLRQAVAETTKGFQDAEGPCLLDHVSRCSFNTDTLTHSTSITMGSDRGRDTPNRTDLSPGLVTHPAVSQCSSVCPSVTRQLDFNQHAGHTQLIPDHFPEGEGKPSLPLLNATASLNTKAVSRRVGRPSHGFESVPEAVTHEPGPFCPSPGSKRLPADASASGVQMIGEGVEAFSPGTRSWRLSHPHHEDEFIGLKTLTEIRKLLGETGTPLTNQQGSITSHFLPDKLSSNSDEIATLAKDGESEFPPQWAVTSPRSNRLLGEGPRTGVGQGHRTPPTVWNTSSIAHTLPGEGDWQEPRERRAITAGGEGATQPALVSRVGRAEPEGCSWATAARSGTEQWAGFSGSCSHPIKLTASKPRTPLSLPQFAGHPERAHVLRDDSRAGGGHEEDSSTDSLAARVSSLLRDQSHATLESNHISIADKGIHRIHGQGQMKLRMKSPGPLAILAEEDRRKIEEIKAELLQTSNNFIHSQDGCSVDAEDLSLPSDLASSVDASPEIEPAPLPPPEFQSVSTARSQISSQLQKLSDNLFDTTVQLRTPLRRNMDKQLKAMDLDSPVSDCTQSPPSQPAKPIIAITFSSRRKPPSSSPQFSTPLPKEIPSQQHGATNRSDEGSPSCIRTVREELAQLPTHMFCEEQEERRQSGPKQSEQLASESSIQGQTMPDTGELPCTVTSTGQKPSSNSPDPCSPSPTRTVLSHIRVTLSPKRPAAPRALPDSIPTPLGNLGVAETQPTGEGPQPALPPPQHDTPDMPCSVACQPAGQGPPYPPLPMPIPAFYPSFLPLFACTSEGKPEPRIPITRDGSKVDVSTQTIIRPSMELPIPAAVTVEQEVSTQTRRTPPGGASRTTISTSSHTLATQGTDVPVLLPYKPAGSTKLFYMPDSGIRSRLGQLDSESSSESWRADSQEAPPTRIQTEALGARGYVSSSKLTTHRERVKRSIAAPRKPREKEEIRLLERGTRRHQGSLTAGAGTLPERMPLQDVGDGDFSTKHSCPARQQEPTRAPEQVFPTSPRGKAASMGARAKQQGGLNHTQECVKPDLSKLATQSRQSFRERLGGIGGGRGGPSCPLLPGMGKDSYEKGPTRQLSRSANSHHPLHRNG